ncbi:MAG TPA: prolipoprotein diacylglyceryl transferase [Candidatus Nanoarchaeia archaeon]|nr:prolipoprotein diacylglyceryl transferase [Candidatus Nanoarchaeia archaeon]
MINPIAFTIGSLQITWYGIIYALSFLIGILIAAKLAVKRNIPKDKIYDFALYLIIFVVIFARLFHVFIYNFSYYINNPSQILQIWKGGVSLIGGFIGAVLAALYFCKKNKINFYDIGDIFVIPLALGTTFGRIGNFINQELYGKITTLPWAVKFDNVTGLRHPTQIYEAIGNFLIFIILLIMWKKTTKKGLLFWTYILVYSFIRFLAEFLRDTPDLVANTLTITQIILVPIFILALFFITKKNEIQQTTNP